LGGGCPFIDELLGFVFDSLVGEHQHDARRHIGLRAYGMGALHEKVVVPHLAVPAHEPVVRVFVSERDRET